MPHVGGGSSSHGGFHSGGSHSSAPRAPRRDIYGKEHHSYYIRPGFYFSGIYVPYSRVHRGYYAIRGIIALICVGIFIVGLGIGTLHLRGSEDALESYSLNRYSEVYQQDSNYEYNVLVEIVAYDNLKELDYMPIVGDNLDYSIDQMFGNQSSFFGNKLYNNLNKYEYQVSSLADALNTSLMELNERIDLLYSNPLYSNNVKDIKIINNTTYSIGDDTSLKEAMNHFYELTGYNICIDISTYDTAYPQAYYMLIVLSIIGGGVIIFGFYRLIKTIIAVEKINEADKNDDLGKYFEGDIKYDEYRKKHSMDEPYTYNPNEYEELKKEFETNPKDFEVNNEDFKEEDIEK